MTRACITAYTPNTSPSPPPYLSINDEGDGYVSFTVRSDADSGSRTAVIKISADEFLKIAHDIAGWHGQHPLRRK